MKARYRRGNRHIVRLLLPLSCVATAQLTAQSSLPTHPTVSVHYRLAPSPGSLEELRRAYKPAELALLEKLNRADPEHLWRLDALVVPDHWDLDELAYSPLPQRYEWAGNKKKVIVVYLPSQVFGGYEFGRLVRWGPVSSGRAERPTPTGLFHLTWKSPGRFSTVDKRWYLPWYFNFVNERGISFHQFDLPGHPASHACIRLLERDAAWLYDWGDQWVLGPRGWKVIEPGTPVLIPEQYRFAQPPPWLSPAWWEQKIELRLLK